jgi:hypothetical protein
MRKVPNIPVVENAVPVEFFSQFNGGLNTKDKPEELAPNQSPDLLNVEATSDGAISTAKGYVELGTDAGTTKVLGLLPYINGATRHLIKAAGYKLIKWDGSTWADIHTYTTASTATSVSGVMAGGFLYIVDGAHAGMEKYAGSTSTANVATPAVFTHIAYLPAVDRLIGISLANPSRVYFSGSGAYETWGANDYLPVAPEDGSDVKGVVPCFGPLLTIKGYGGSGKFTWDGLTFGTTGLRSIYGAGASAPKAVCVLPYGGVAFFNRDGVWMNSGGSQQDTLLSENITPTIQSITAGQLGKVRMHWFDNKLWLALPLGNATENNALFCLDFGRNPDGSLRGWYKYDWTVSEFATFEDGLGNLNLIMGSTTTSKAMRRYREDETATCWSKNGAAMDSYWCSFINRGARKAKPKNYKRLVYSLDCLSALVSGQDGIIDLSYRADASDSWRSLDIDTYAPIDKWEDTGVWGEDGDKWPSLGKKSGIFEDFFFTSYSIQFRVRKVAIDTPLVFYGVAYEEEELESYT